MITKNKFLRLHIGTSGICAGKDRKRIVNDWPKPTTVSELRGYIRLLQYFCRFIYKFLDIATPLTNLNRKGRSTVDCDAKCDSGFATIAQKLVCSLIMQTPD